MIKILFICLIVITVNETKAQWVNIPDANFRNWLNANGFSSCMNGSMMDTTCTAVVNAISINFDNSIINDLYGIQFFDSLKTLICTYNHVFSLPVLPSKLVHFDCSNNYLTSLPNLPASLKTLECANNDLAVIPSLPAFLTKFYCHGNSLISLPNLPSTIDSLSCTTNQLTSLPPLPSSLRHLWCYDNQLTSLPTLPSGLYNLQCQNNQLTSLPAIPALVFLIACTDNQLSSLPVLPVSLISLQASNNQLTSLPVLPSGLRTLFCDHNLLTSLPSLPASLNYWIMCGNNPLIHIPDLPDSINMLDISNITGLVCFPRYKKITSLQWSNTNVSCLPNTGYIGTANPPINALPICSPPVATITPAGSLTFCIGESVTLNANTGAGFTYRWIKNGSLIAGATSQSYPATASGNYSVEVTHNCGFATSTAVVVTVKSLPLATITPSGPTTFCSGGNVVLNAVVAANRTYQWKKGGNLLSGATLSSYTATTGGNYRVIVTNTVTGCSKTTGSTTVVTVNALPTATVTPQGSTTFCAGGSVVLQANTGAGLTYKWKKGTNYISAATLSNYTATTGGNYKVQVTNSNGCSKTSAGVVVSVPCRLNESLIADNNLVNIFPNPFTSVISIDLRQENIQEVKVMVRDIVGKIVFSSRESNRRDGYTKTFDLSFLSKGMYMLELNIDGQNTEKKIVKE